MRAGYAAALINQCVDNLVDKVVRCALCHPRCAGSTLCGLQRDNALPANLARAAVEGLLCGLADGLDAMRAASIRPGRVILVGGGSRLGAVLALAPDVLGLPVVRPAPTEHVALGAARQAAWALSGADAPPDWALSAGMGAASEPRDIDAGAAVRGQCRQHRLAVFGI
jgi:xylulokinase